MYVYSHFFINACVYFIRSNAPADDPRMVIQPTNQGEEMVFKQKKYSLVFKEKNAHFSRNIKKVSKKIIKYVKMYFCVLMNEYILKHDFNHDLDVVGLPVFSHSLINIYVWKQTIVIKIIKTVITAKVIIITRRIPVWNCTTSDMKTLPTGMPPPPGLKARFSPVTSMFSPPLSADVFCHIVYPDFEALRKPEFRRSLCYVVNAGLGEIQSIEILFFINSYVIVL